MTALQSRTMLTIADDLELPLDAVTEAFGVVGVRGSGKSYASKVLTEELTKAGLPVVVLDPLGVFWGLRSSADGERPGLPFVIFGGDHGDIPLNESAGDVVADFVMAERVPVVLDMSLLRKAEMRRFATAFLSRLYHRNRQPLHVVVDEADLFAPQRMDDPRLLGAMEDLVRRGRAKGIGCTLITQRPAVISKDVLTQISTLVALRLAGPQDRKALDEWIRANGTDEQRAEFIGSLASLPTGTAWVWSPHWLGTFQRVQVRQLETFDSSATPKSGEARIEPRAFADVDLESLRERMAATIDRAKADDPKELRKRIAELERELKNHKPETVVERVEVPVLNVGLVNTLRGDLQYIIDQAHNILSRADEACVALQHAEVAELTTVKGATDSPEYVKRAVADFGHRFEALAKPAEDIPVPNTRPQMRAEKRNHAAERAQPAEGITAPQQRILDALAALHAFGLKAPSKSNVAVFADASPTSSGYSNNLGRLRTAGLIDYPAGGRVALTADGGRLANEDEPITSVGQLHDAWCEKLSGPQSRIIRALTNAYPEPMQKGYLAERVGQSATSSGYTNNLGHLRSLGLLDYPSPGWVVATELLFPEIAR